MAPQTFTGTYTRTQVVVDQVDVFLRYAGVGAAERERILNGINQKWLEAVGVFLIEGGLRVLEAEIKINWHAHSDHADLSISGDLPGWEDGGAPEVIVFGRRFGATAQTRGLHPNFWVRFVASIRADPDRHRRLCESLGVIYGGTVPAWKSPPRSRSMTLQDLAEVAVSLREAE